jgi:transcriptional regulator with XRE-family HTH domain
MFTPAQCRAARGLIDWQQGDLALSANVSRQTVSDFESGKRMPVPNNLAAIGRALEEVGIEFSSVSNDLGERGESVTLWTHRLDDAGNLISRSDRIKELADARELKRQQREQYLADVRRGLEKKGRS